MSGTTAPAGVWIDEEPQAFTRLQYSSTSPTDMVFPPSRATSPTSLVPFRFSTRSDNPTSQWNGKESQNSDFFAGRVRRASTQSKVNDKGKDPINGKDSVDSSTNLTPTSSGYGDPFTPSRYNTSSFTSPETSRPSTSDGPSNLLRKPRGSILVAASDALGFKFGRRRQPVRQPPMPIILPDVIEISAPRRDEEVEERNRLRDMAAQSIGLPVIMKTDNRSLNESVEEINEGEAEEGEEAEEHIVPVAENREPSKHRTWESMTNLAGKSPQGSSLSIAIPSPAIPNRYRAGSLLGHSRTNSTTLAPVPSFPTNITALNPFKQSVTTLHKYYPSSSLRIFALSRNWRSRFIVLSTPTSLVTRGSGPPVSYLHLFKSPNGDEKEMERLEINENSVVFVAEEDVAGRKHVVKVGGVDVGALKKELNHEEGGRTMWFLHITDPAEAQEWITAIKTAIFGQRTMRAGLGLPGNTPGTIEPRGDMDVMLSMQAQRLITSPTASVRQSSTPPPIASQPDRNYASSISSHRSQATVARSVSSGAVSTLKGLFTGSTRPRSASRATSIESDRPVHDREPHDESFASMGSHLLSGVRPSTADSPASTFSPQPITTHASLPFSGSILSPEHRLERKIVTDRPMQWASAETVQSKDRANRGLSLGALSLQPPPRKRWTSIEPTTSGSKDIGVYRHVNGNSSRAGSIGATYDRGGEIEMPSSPTQAGFTFGTPEQRPRAPSIQSVSTLASGENTLSVERSSSSTKRSSMKRWSRQGGVLPRRLTPPSGPPPSVPSSQPSSSRTMHHPYAGDRPSSRASSHSGNSQRSVVSSLPSFSKRASGSSAFSVSSSTSQSNNISRPTSISGHRLSVPPPRPAPTFALPLAPDQDHSKQEPSPSNKSSFRDSVGHRAFRLSLMAPKPPPSTVLPPRPDEPEYRTHRRNSSAGSYTPTSLHSIPASPTPPALTVSPFPPPLGPLPPTPVSNSPTSSTPSRQVSRHTSIKQRLRILSAPSPSSSAPPQQGGTPPNGVHHISRPPTAMPVVPFTTSPPATPIAERITLYQNDPSFLQLHTPITSSLPPLRPLPPPPEPYAELNSLSPPPRRGSKQISVLEIESEAPADDDKPTVEGEHKMMSLSRPGSVISLGIVSM